MVQQDFSQVVVVVEGSSHLSSPSPTELETPIYTFTLPDLTSFTGTSVVVLVWFFCCVGEISCNL